MKENETIAKTLLIIERYKGSFQALRSAALTGEFSPKSKAFSRLLLWKTCLITENLNFQQWASKLKLSRVVYHKLRRNAEMIVPYWLLDTDSDFYVPAASESLSRKRLTKLHKLVRIMDIKDDPLSVEYSQTPDEQRHLLEHSVESDDLELLQSIILDVHRLFPGEPLFLEIPESALKHKRRIVNILYVWSKCNPQVGYKQGIHEILGLLYMNIVKESVLMAPEESSQTQISSTDVLSAEDMSILSLYDMNYIEHDLFTMLNRFLVASGVVHLFFQSESELMNSINFFNVQLMKVDQLIHYNLITKLKLESLLWSIRFFRLLLLRELGNDLEVPASLWDMLIAAELEKSAGLSSCLPTLVTYMIVVLLIHLKTDLVLCDFSEALSLLLHYPIADRLHIYPDFAHSLFKDAYKLYSVRDNDLKLYETGLKFNKIYNTKLRVSLNYVSLSDSNSNTSSAKSSVDIPPPVESKSAKMAFEKYRLEMRLKKKAQLILNGNAV